MRHLLTIIALFLTSISVSAATAQFKRIWIETNVDKDGEKGLMIHKRQGCAMPGYILRRSRRSCIA